jgi:hypothetical protein
MSQKTMSTPGALFDGLLKITVLTMSGVTVLNSNRSREDRCPASRER